MPNTIRRWRAKRRYRTTMKELRSLSQWELRQLGIKPGELRRIALGLALSG